MWSVMLDRDFKGVIHEDNMSTIEVTKNGYSPKLKHLAKHHRISLGLTHELCQSPDLEVRHCDTNLQKGDMMTKGLARPKHDPACKLVGLCPYVIDVSGALCLVIDLDNG